MNGDRSNATNWPIHLVGSIPLESSAAVFDAVGATLGPSLARVPDGETGIRANWIGWQHQVFARQECLEPGTERERDYQLQPPYRFRPGRNAGDLDLGPLGFAREAIASYREFERRKGAGIFSPGSRFQVCLPTPFAPVYSFVAYRDQGQVEPCYEARMLEELAEICAAIPNGELAVQWDVATEMSIFEHLYGVPFLGDGAETGLIDRLARLGNAVPEAVSLGYHLCYGDMNHQHWKEPEDTKILVNVANQISATVRRPIHWLHIPVPRDRDDADYFTPLRDLELRSETELFLGLVHLTDGVEGARKRIAAARDVVGSFGVGTECGFGRRDPNSIDRLQRLHLEVADSKLE